jgi:osmoprotectant transport system substrate-binding protein
MIERRQPMVPRPRLVILRRLGPAAGVVAALALCGCGNTSHSHSQSRSTSRSASASTDASTSTSTTSQGTTGIGATKGPALPGTGRPRVTIGDKNYTEQFVLGQLYLQALQAQGFSVNITQNIGPPAVFTQALKNGSLAMYPEYLSDFDSTVAHLHRNFGDRDAVLAAGRRFAHRHGLRLLSPTPFSDTDAIAVTDAFAANHHLSSLGDLGDIGSSLQVGGAAQLQNTAPGLPSLARTYGVDQAHFQPLAVGDQYTDLNTGTVQAAFVNTTDGELSSGDYRVLADPQRIFGWGNVVPVVSSAALAKEGPAFAATIERVDRELTLPVMRALNNAVDAAGQDPTAVATQFLQTHGLLSPLPTPSG